MSGLEITGVVLGVFPLILSALEGYENGFSLMKDWWKFRTEFKGFVHDIDTQRALFLENIEALLCPIVEDDRQMEALLSDAGGAVWQDEDLEERLRERLPKTYELYVQTVMELNAAVTKLVGKLDVDNGILTAKDSPTVGKKIKWEYEYKRIRFTLQRKKRDLLVEKLEKHNKKLQDILNSSERLEVSRRTRKKPLAAAFTKIQEQALHLHQVISKSWHCACPSAHGANLMLEKRMELAPQAPRSPRPSTPRSPGFPMQDAGRFKVLFYYETNPFELPSNWSETEVVVDDEETEHPQTHSHSHSPSVDHNGRPSPVIRSSSSPSKPLTGESQPLLQEKTRTKSMLSWRSSSSKSLRPVSPNPGGGGKSGRKSVSFSPEPLSPSSLYAGSPFLSPSFNDSASTLVEEGPSHSHTVSEVADLCQLVKECSSQHSKCLGYLSDTTKKRKFKFFPFCTDTHHPRTHELISLEALLSSSFKLTRKDRLSIASTLASSLLQLQSTPWLGEGWSKKDILFLRNKHDPRKPIMADRPYISRSFLSSKSPTPSTTGQNGFSPRDPEKPLLSLAILLLELCFGESLESQTHIRNKFLGPTGEKNDFTDFATAKEWLVDVEGEAGADFHVAVKKCLMGCFDGARAKVDLGDEEFRKSVWEEVVMPIEEVVKAFG